MQHPFLLIISLSIGIAGCIQTPTSTTKDINHQSQSSHTFTLNLPKVRFTNHRTETSSKHFVRFAQCQIQVEVGLHQNTQYLWRAKKPIALYQDLHACLDTAIAEKIDVMILPELSLSLPEEERKIFLRHLSEVAKTSNMIIVAGSYYDEDRYSRIAVVGPGWRELGYKIRPSRFEVSPLANEGMKPGNELLVLQTDYGNIAVITCVDLISDEIQFLIRTLATRNEIDVLVNINHNPAALEFLIEANSIVRRHPIFASITNAYAPASENCLTNSLPQDNGYCYGHSAVLASLRTKPHELPNSSQRIIEMLPTSLLTQSNESIATDRRLPYSNVVADVGAFREALLIYELNMRLKHVPRVTNAPDQGYPPIRGIKIIDLLQQK